MRTGTQQFSQLIFTSLDSILFGGIYDHIGGGFFRHSMDERWLEPSFEKMLYDQALMIDLCAGIGGGLTTPLGGTALATVSIAADLGAESPDGFIPLSTLGFGADTHPVDRDLLAALGRLLPEAVRGPILSVNTVTGTASSTRALRDRYPDAVAEGMEGFGVASAAAGAGVPFAELRTISNPVGPRDRDAWRIGDALAALTAAGRALGKLAW